MIFWRNNPVPSLPDIPLELVKEDPNLPEFPTLVIDQLAAFVDAAYGTDVRTRKSITGLIVMLANAALAWKSKLQTFTATSSTEAEFLAAVLAAKLIKYL